MAQKEEGNTTGYLDVVDIPPIINNEPRLLNKENDGGNNHRDEVQLTDLSASAANGLRIESKVEGNVVYIEDVVLERVSLMSV
jgi:hypothetical protein